MLKLIDTTVNIRVNSSPSTTVIAHVLKILILLDAIKDGIYGIRLDFSKWGVRTPRVRGRTYQ